MNRRSSAILVLLAVFAASTPMLGVNDFWLGNRYSVGVTYLPKQEAWIDPPLPKSVQMPDYPVELMRVAVSGQALIEFTVAPDGTVRDLKIVQAYSPAFGEAAKVAVTKWAFFPAKDRRTGKAVSTIMQCRFDFRVEEEPNKTSEVNGRSEK
jgi:TonB family protein